MQIMNWAKNNPPGYSMLPEWRAKIVRKRLIAECEVGDNNVSA